MQMNELWNERNVNMQQSCYAVRPRIMLWQRDLNPLLAQVIMLVQTLNRLYTCNRLTCVLDTIGSIPQADHISGSWLVQMKIMITDGRGRDGCWLSEAGLAIHWWWALSSSWSCLALLPPVFSAGWWWSWPVSAHAPVIDIWRKVVFLSHNKLHKWTRNLCATLAMLATCLRTSTFSSSNEHSHANN